MQLEDIYMKGQYLDKNPTWHIEDSEWKANHIINLINSHHLPISSICEIGCGAGEILRQLFLKMPNNIIFSGYELSPQAFNLCQTRETERLNFKCQNLFEDLEAYFDLALCIDVFEHVDDYINFLRKLKDKASYKIFHIPLDISLSSVLRVSPILQARQNVGHIHYFTKETALATLEDTGYQIIDYHITAGSIDLPITSFKTRLAKIPRQLLYMINPSIAARVLGGYSLLVIAK